MIRLNFKLFKPTRKTIDRKALVKFHSSNHKPMIETRRYDQTPRDKRLSPVCDFNKIEDEIHFLRYCPQFSKLALRQNCFPDI